MEPWYKYFMGIDYDENSVQLAETTKMLEACARDSIPAARLYGKMTLAMA
jgi:hypothetical protein